MNRLMLGYAFSSPRLAVAVAVIVVGLSAVLATQPQPAAAAGTYALPEPTLGLTGLAGLGEVAPGAVASGGLSPESVPGLLSAIGSSQSSLLGAAAARHEHTLATAADAEARAAIRSGGLTPDRSSALSAAETRLAAATAALQGAESDLRDIAYDALVARVGAENALLARRVAANASKRVPDAWKALDMPPGAPGDRGWQTLESAWFKARRGLPDGAFTQDERAALAAAQSNATVALVQQRLDANLAGVQAAWLQFMQQHAAAE